MDEDNRVYGFERETVFRGKWAGVVYWQRERAADLWRHRPDGAYTHSEHEMQVEWTVDRICLVDGIPGQIMNAVRYW